MHQKAVITLLGQFKVNRPGRFPCSEHTFPLKTPTLASCVSILHVKSALYGRRLTQPTLLSHHSSTHTRDATCFQVLNSSKVRPCSSQ